MRPYLLVLGAIVGTIAFGSMLTTLDTPAYSTAFSDFAQLGAATLGALGCARGARRSPQEWRAAWAWLAAGTGAWAAGQAVWTYYEVVAGREVPFPSLADFGFLAFPMLAARGMVLWLGTQDSAFAKGRHLLDGMLVAGSLLALSWVTALGSVVNAGPGVDWLAFLLSVDYPVGDIVVATLALMALARGRHEQQTNLILLALGLLSVSCADSAFVYLTNTQQFSSSDVVANAGWFLGFLLVGLAGSGLAAPHDAGARRPVVTRRGGTMPARLRTALPYVPLAIAIAVLAVGLTDEVGGQGGVLLVFAGALVALMMLRQFLATLDNQRLLADLAEARDALHHQALHDALTGLPNRVLFAQRLDQALERCRSDISVLFCDLNDFKPINDHYGHETGDHVLREVGARMVSAVRVADTVARMGGDEFAVLLEHGGDATQAVERIAEALAEGVLVDGHRIALSMSVGRAQLAGTTGATTPTPEDRAREAAELLRVADLDMYDLKAAHHRAQDGHDAPSRTIGRHRPDPVLAPSFGTVATPQAG